MAMTALQAFVFILLGSLAVSMALNVTFHPEPETWIDADAICRSKGGNLLVSEQPFNNGTLIDANNTNAEVWIGRFNTPWSFNKGCFHMTEPDNYKEVKSMYNQQKECGTVCKDSAFFGLQKSLCICLKEITNFIPTVPRDCDVTCPGNDDETCGGEHAFSIYGLGHDKEISRDDIGKYCIALRHDGNDVTFFQESCDRRHGFSCRPTIDTDTGLYMFVNDSEKRTWQGARKTCRTCPNCNGLVGIKRLTIGSGQTLWTQFSRNTSWVHPQGPVLNPDVCYAIQAVGLADFNETVLNCSERRPFLCQSDEEAIVEKIDASTEASLKGGIYAGVCVGVVSFIVLCVLVGYSIWRHRNSERLKISDKEDDSHAICSDEFSADSTFINEQASYMNMEQDRGGNRDVAEERLSVLHVTEDCLIEETQSNDAISDDPIEYSNVIVPEATGTSVTADIRDEIVIRCETGNQTANQSPNQCQENAYATIDEEDNDETVSAKNNGAMNLNMKTVDCSGDLGTLSHEDNIRRPLTHQENGRTDAEQEQKRESLYDMIDDEPETKKTPQYASVDKTPNASSNNGPNNIATRIQGNRSSADNNIASDMGKRVDTDRPLSGCESDMSRGRTNSGYEQVEGKPPATYIDFDSILTPATPMTSTDPEGTVYDN